MSIRLIVLMLSIFIVNMAAMAQSSPELVSFSISPSSTERGGTVIISWEVRGVDRVAIEQYYGYRTPPDVRYETLPAKGTLTVTLDYSQPTEFNYPQPYLHEAIFFLLLPDVQPSVWYSDAGVLAQQTVTISCPDDSFFFGTDPYYAHCPIAPAHTVSALYQPFEHGFMVWRGDTGSIYIFYINPDGVSGPALQFQLKEYLKWEASLNPSAQSPAAGFYGAEGLLGRVRNGSHHALVDSLGWATDPQTAYQPIVQDSLNGAFVHPLVYFTLPDGAIVRFVTDLYGSQWSFIEPDAQETPEAAA